MWPHTFSLDINSIDPHEIPISIAMRAGVSPSKLAYKAFKGVLWYVFALSVPGRPLVRFRLKRPGVSSSNMADKACKGVP